MKYYDWNKEKNNLLKETRGISFEEIIFAISNGNLLEVIQNSNKKNIPIRKCLLLKLEIMFI